MPSHADARKADERRHIDLRTFNLHDIAMIVEGTPSYRPYTTKFDIEVNASQIDLALCRLREDQREAVDEAWDRVQTGLLPWRTELHMHASQSAARIRQLLSCDERSTTAVTLLFDHSGSMRGQKMLYAAATADVIQEWLLTLGFTCEVLGFTTLHWRGGRSRNRWKWRFRP